jgi:transposase-like protein
MTGHDLNPPRSATTEEMIHAFRLTARYSGNAAKAARELEINGDTLREWRRKHNELYLRVAREETENIRQAESEKHLQVAAEARDLESEVLLKVRAALEQGQITGRELGNLARNLATESGIHTDKALALLGDNGVQVNLNIDLSEMVRSWASTGAKFYDAEGNEVSPDKVIEGSAEDVTETAGIPATTEEPATERSQQDA